MARTARDCALILQAIAGRDPHDATSAEVPVPNYLEGLGPDLKGLRFGVPREYFGQGLDAQVEREVRAALKNLEGLGATLEEVSAARTPSTKHRRPTTSWRTA